MINVFSLVETCVSKWTLIGIDGPLEAREATVVNKDEDISSNSATVLGSDKLKNLKLTKNMAWA